MPIRKNDRCACVRTVDSSTRNLLVESGGVRDCASVGTSAQTTAAWEGHVEVVRYLCVLDVSRGVDPSVDEHLGTSNGSQKRAC